MSTEQKNDIEKKLEKLEGELQQVKNFGWVILTVAVIFGISGAFGWSALDAAQKALSKLNTDIETRFC